jgi:hypothetical protein
MGQLRPELRDPVRDAKLLLLGGELLLPLWLLLLLLLPGRISTS